jgi:hypothetical protein
VDLGVDYTISSWAIYTDDKNGCTAATIYGAKQAREQQGMKQ